MDALSMRSICSASWALRAVVLALSPGAFSRERLCVPRVAFCALRVLRRVLRLPHSPTFSVGAVSERSIQIVLSSVYCS